MNAFFPVHAWQLPVLIGALSLVLRAVVALYYADGQRVLRILRLAPRVEGVREQYYRPFDAWLAPFPFLWIWLDIVAAVLAASLVGRAWAWALVVIWVGGRFRALQEFGHNAVHFALCRSHGFQWWLSDFFYQFPAFKRDMFSRQVTHTREHHRHPNHPSNDPNRLRVAAGGMVFPLTQAQFYVRLLYPLTRRGVRDNLSQMARNARLNRNGIVVACRLASLALAGGVLYLAGGWQGVLFGWVLPLLTSYPLFAWLALLAEHRWFADAAPEGADRLAQELHAGRPTDYAGLSGWLVRRLVSPTSDAYHLAHSLYPGVRWNYLPVIDRQLKIDNPEYTRFASSGLLHARDGIPSALSELRARLCPAERIPSTPSEDNAHEH